MTVTLALQNEPSTLFSSGSTFANPLNLTFDGVSGGTKEINLLLKNTESSSISISSIEIDGSSSAVTSVEFKLDGVANYTPDAIVGSPLTLPSNQSQSFWMKVVVPNGTSITNVKDLELKVEYT